MGKQKTLLEQQAEQMKTNMDAAAERQEAGLAESETGPTETGECQECHKIGPCQQTDDGWLCPTCRAEKGTQPPSDPEVQREGVQTALAKAEGQPDTTALFQRPAADVGDITREAGVVSAVAREEGELKTSILLAKQWPRIEAEAEGAIRRSCGRPSFAATALYSFPRGGTTIQGPSVNLARELARCWGNLRHGVRIVSEDNERVHLKGYSFDLQTNNYIEHENKFAKLIPRKRGGKTVWIEPNERDLRELIGRHGAILQRNAILQNMPRDLVDLAIRLVQKTQKDGATLDPVGETQNILSSFAALGVHASHIAEKYQHPVENLTAEELVELRQIYTSIRDGQSTRGEHFNFAKNGPPKSNGSRTENLAEKLANGGEK